jgi:hypothetical protein
MLTLIDVGGSLPHYKQYFLRAITMLFKIKRVTFDEGLVSKLGHGAESFAY